MPRARYQPSEKDNKTVEAMAAVGVPQEAIAKVIGIDPKTLRARFRDVLDIASTQANAKVGATLFAMATSGRDVSASIFWAKTRMGWKETAAVEHTGKDGEALKIEIVYADHSGRIAAPASGAAISYQPSGTV